MVFTILWKRQSKAAAIISPILGFGTGLGVWLGTAYSFGGAVSVASTGEVLPCVYGTVASCFSPIIYSVVITLIRPQNYDWADFKKENLALEKLEGDLTTAHHDHDESRREGVNAEDGGVRSSAFETQELTRWGRIAAGWSIATFLGHWVLWPLPMYGSGYVFGKKVSLLCRKPDMVYSRAIANRFKSSTSPGLWLALSGSGVPCSSQSSTQSLMAACSRSKKSTVA